MVSRKQKTRTSKASNVNSKKIDVTEQLKSVASSKENPTVQIEEVPKDASKVLIDIPENNDSSVNVMDMPELDREEKKVLKKRGRPKGSKNGTASGKTKAVKIKASSPKKVDKNKIVRVSKHLTSVKDKLVRIYGNNQDKLLGLAKQKEKFETAVFDFKEEQLTPFNLEFNSIDLKLSDFVAVEISEDELNEMINLNKNEIEFNIGNDHFATMKNEYIQLPAFNFGIRQGFIFNTGGFVSDMAWTRLPGSDIQYLAVSVSDTQDAADPDLRLSGTPTPRSALINIYEFDKNQAKMSLFYQLVHDAGLSWDLKWHPAPVTDEKYIGVLTGVFQDGCIKFLPIMRSVEGHIHHLQNPCIDIKGPESAITSFDFISSDYIVCGFQNGYYGEYSITESIFCNYKQLFESYVISTIALRSNFENTAVCMSAIDGNCCIFDPKDIRLTKTFSTRTRGSNTLPLVYMPQLYTVLRTDSLSSVKAFTPRAIFVDHNICQHDNTVVCLGSSSLHPMLLSGSADGSLQLNNIVRRMLQGLKNNTDIYRYVRLWKWDFNAKTKQYRLNPQYKIFKFSNTETSNVKLDYPGINIQSVKWIEEMNCGKWYSFANAAGFVVVERLGN